METKKQSIAIKIIIPLLIILVIIGIFVLKNAGKNSEDISGKEIPLTITEVDMKAALSHNLPIIIDFGADSCIPCKEMAPVLEKINEEMQGKAVIQFVDVWQYPEAAQEFPVQVIPTQIFIMPDGSPYVPTKDIGVELISYASNETGEHAFTAHQGGLTEEQMRMILEDMGVS